MTLVGFVDLEPRELEMGNDPLGQHLPGIVRRVFLKEPSQEIAVPCDRKADREGELSAERAVIHGAACSHSVPVRDRPAPPGLSRPEHEQDS
jgi:hypothetical protein